MGGENHSPVHRAHKHISRCPQPGRMITIPRCHQPRQYSFKSKMQECARAAETRGGPGARRKSQSPTIFLLFSSLIHSVCRGCVGRRRVQVTSDLQVQLCKSSGNKCWRLGHAPGATETRRYQNMRHHTRTRTRIWPRPHKHEVVTKTNTKFSTASKTAATVAGRQSSIKLRRGPATLDSGVGEPL